MSIQIIDGFKLGVSKPVDDRMVTSGTSSRNNIAYKYEGLRVFDIAQKTAFVWIDGQWKKESETSVSSGVIPGLTGTLNKVVKFTDTNKIGDSSIFDNGTRVGIGTTTPDAAVRLDVDGNIKADSFQGLGTYLTAINAGNITTGSLSIARISNGGANQILASGTSAPQWIDISTLNSGTVLVTDETSNTDNQYINFTSAPSGYNILKVSSTKLRFNPGSGQVLLGGGAAASPVYSFIDNRDTGIYRLSGEKSIGFSTSGTNRMTIKSDGKVGIGTTSPYTSLHIVGQTDNVNASTSNTAGQIFLSDPDSISQGLVLGYAYYAGQYEYARIQTQGNFSLVLQEKGGRVKIGQVSNYYDAESLLDVNGQTRIRGILNIGDKTGGDAQLEIGSGRTTNGNAYIDLTGTANQADYDFRIIRGNEGTNAVTYLTHKGTGNFEITAENAASIYLKTGNSERIRITDQGIRAQNGTVAAPSYFFDGETTTGIYRADINTIGISTSGTVAVQIGAKVIINKTFNIPTNAGAGKILTSNASGDASWETMASSLPIGTIVDYIGSSAPSGWLVCDGTQYDGYYIDTIVHATTYTDYYSLYLIIPNSYRTQTVFFGTTTYKFTVPDLRGKVSVGADYRAGEWEFDTIGETGGSKYVTLTSAQSGLPAHTHTFTGNALPNHSHTYGAQNSNTSGDSNYAETAAFSGGSRSPETSANSAGTPTGTIGSNAAADASQAHTNLQPYLVVNKIIKYM